MSSARSLGVLALIAAAIAVAAPAAARASQSATDTIDGLEYFATSTHGKFVGTANGALPGGWRIDVTHTKLCVSCPSTAVITSGSFQLATRASGSFRLISGAFGGGTVQVLRRGSHCTKQRFAVTGVLRRVGPLPGGDGTGAFTATLTHYRRSIFGQCVTYAASVKGSLRMSF